MPGWVQVEYDGGLTAASTCRGAGDVWEAATGSFGWAFLLEGFTEAWVPAYAGMTGRVESGGRLCAGVTGETGCIVFNDIVY